LPTPNSDVPTLCSDQFVVFYQRHEEVIYYEHRLPEGQKLIIKPIQAKSLLIKVWRNERKESDIAWKVDIKPS
jgi:hypothetical protein